jgi:hypothetical protein
MSSVQGGHQSPNQGIDIDAHGVAKSKQQALKKGKQQMMVRGHQMTLNTRGSGVTKHGHPGAAQLTKTKSKDSKDLKTRKGGKKDKKDKITKKGIDGVREANKESQKKKKQLWEKFLAVTNNDHTFDDDQINDLSDAFEKIVKNAHGKDALTITKEIFSLIKELAPDTDPPYDLNNITNFLKEIIEDKNLYPGIQKELKYPEINKTLNGALKLLSKKIRTVAPSAPKNSSDLRHSLAKNTQHQSRIAVGEIFFNEVNNAGDNEKIHKELLEGVSPKLRNSGSLGA